jgi:hypothetical protein
MSSEHTEELAAPPVSRDQQTSDDRRDNKPANPASSNNDATREGATVLVRGQTISTQETKSPPKEVSEAKVKLQSRLSALDDDADVGVQKEQIVIRDGKADIAFTGTLLASAAPASAPKGQWQEYRVYETNGGKHVFSKVGRSIFAGEADTHEAEIFDPAPSSVPSQLLRSARDLTRSRPMTWIDAAVAFFGYDPLAKALYRKLSGQFEEHIT